MDNIFTTMLKQAADKGVATNNVVDARDWLQSKTSTINTSRELSKLKDRYRNQIQIGRMYLFHYDAKHKRDLPYYDMFPLIFPFQKAPGGFYGINLHYLPYNYRALLMDGLYSLVVNESKNDETTRLRLSYQVLMSMSKLRYFKPCVKHYLNSNIRSKFVYITPEEWNIALFLPLQKFNKGNIQQVYKDSVDTIRGVR
jgi:hypothetical protein